jgi:hypothetical protein
MDAVCVQINMHARNQITQEILVQMERSECIHQAQKKEQSPTLLRYDVHPPSHALHTFHHKETPFTTPVASF